MLLQQIGSVQAKLTAMRDGISIIGIYHNGEKQCHTTCVHKCTRTHSDTLGEMQLLPQP